MQISVDKKYTDLEKTESELKACEEKLSADPKIALNNPVIKSLMKHGKITELTKEIMDAFIATIWVHEELATNPETAEKERKLKVTVGFKFEELV